MKASLRWLRELVPQLPDDAAEVAKRLTGAGLEVEGTHAYGAGTEACVVAKVVAMRPHPSRPALRLVTVDRGGATQEVVCGASNVPDPGGLVVLAPLGAHLPAAGMTIEKRAIGGVDSEGMLCSESELGLAETSEGILILPPGLAAPGTPLVRAEPSVRDTVFEIGLTPNRADCLGHVGLAREAAALFLLPFALPDAAPPAKLAQGEALERLIQITIEDGERCPHYAGGVLLGATIAPSPAWLRYRLASLGVRPISNAVDVTNEVLLGFGHPMHAFDLERVHGAKIVVRRAKDGEKIRTLDGVDRTLVADDLVICDGEGPVALGGVMGGGDSEISAKTTKILLEAAFFDPRGVRRTARRQSLHTEASHRYERGVDHGSTKAAMGYAIQLMSRLTGASAVPGIVFTQARAIAAKSTTFRHARPEELLGVPVPKDEAHAILERLGIHRTAAGEQADTYAIPSFRPDIAREVDLVEEVARVRGFDQIPAKLPAIRASRDVGTRESFARSVRAAATSVGLSEALTYAFVSPQALAAVSAPEATVKLKNPLSDQQTVMRTSLAPGMLDAVARARRHGERDVALFTVGPLFLPSGEERLAFAAVLAGERPGYLAKGSSVDVWDAKGVAEGVLTRLLRKEVVVTSAAGDQAPKHLHPRGAASITVEGKLLGHLGPLHPDVVDALDLGDGVLLVELDLAAVEEASARTPKFAPIPRFPASTRDVALVVSDSIPAGEVLAAVKDAAGALAEHVEIFDRFVGGALPKEHASLAFHVVYRAADRTLTDAEVDLQHAKVVSAVEKQFGATLRA